MKTAIYATIFVIVFVLVYFALHQPTEKVGEERTNIFDVIEATTIHFHDGFPWPEDGTLWMQDCDIRTGHTPDQYVVRIDTVDWERDYIGGYEGDDGLFAGRLTWLPILDTVYADKQLLWLEPDELTRIKRVLEIE